jgi:microcystin-dependent protein
MAEGFLGEIRMFGGNFAPKSWATCDGQLLAIASNQALFAIIGTYYGGNGVQTFALPDLRGRIAMDQGTGPGLTTRVIGESAGTENVTLLYNNLAAHTHAVNLQANASTQAATNTDPTGGFLGNSGVQQYAATTDGSQMGVARCDLAGANLPHTNLQPFLCVTFIIALYGFFPTRN